MLVVIVFGLRKGDEIPTLSCAMGDALRYFDMNAQSICSNKGFFLL